jgi:hypothetical protein
LLIVGKTGMSMELPSTMINGIELKVMRAEIFGAFSLLSKLEA